MRSITLVSSAALVLLAGCAGGERPVKPADKPIEYAVPVAVPCVAEGGRPAKVQPLRERYAAEQWAALPPGSKAQAVAAQAGKRMNREDSLEAATAGCN